MNEEVIRNEIQRMVRAIGFEDYHAPDVSSFSSKTAGISTGRPDIYAFNGHGPTIVIEVKKFDALKVKEEWFNPSIISNAQRDWLDWWVFGRKAHGYLGIGTTFGNPRKLWIIPWKQWDIIEQNISMAERLDREDNAYIFPGRLPLHILNYGAVHFECEYHPSIVSEKILSYWTLPAEHEILRIPTTEHMKIDWNVTTFRNPNEVYKKIRR